MNPFQYCKQKHGSCSCEKSGEALCQKTIKEALRPIDTTPPSRIDDPRYGLEALIEQVRFLPTISSLEAASLGYKIRVPRIQDTIKFDETVPMRPVQEYDEVELYRKDPKTGYITMEDFNQMVKSSRFPITHRRTGSIPKDKRKPHHAFLEDPVKRRRN